MFKNIVIYWIKNYLVVECLKDVLCYLLNKINLVYSFICFMKSLDEVLIFLFWKCFCCSLFKMLVVLNFVLLYSCLGMIFRVWVMDLIRSCFFFVIDWEKFFRYLFSFILIVFLFVIIVLFLIVCCMIMMVLCRDFFVFLMNCLVLFCKMIVYVLVLG